MKIATNIELKPCPFCGGESEFILENRRQKIKMNGGADK